MSQNPFCRLLAGCPRGPGGLHGEELPSRLKLQGARTKLIFKDAIRGLLPDGILSRGKMGFAVPIGSWLRRELQPLVSEYVLESGKRHDFFDGATIQRLWREYQSGLRDRTTELWGILIFNMWHDRFARPPAVTADAAGDRDLRAVSGRWPT